LDYRASGPINIAGSPHIRGEFLNNGIRIFQTQMHEREAFRVIFSFGGTVEALNTEQVSNLDAAVKNARAFVAGVVTMLQQSAKAEVA
jgi:chromosome partitioning protein